MGSSTRAVSGVLSLLVMASLLTSRPASGESVSMSRYRLIFDASGSQSVDSTALTDLCRDEDGCTMTVLVTDLNETYANAIRFFLNSNGLGWAHPTVQNQADDDNATFIILAAGEGGHNCFFTDSDAGPDSAPGFRVGFSTNNENPAACAFTIID
jgi:hypothetical protein